MKFLNAKDSTSFLMRDCSDVSLMDVLWLMGVDMYQPNHAFKMAKNWRADKCGIRPSLWFGHHATEVAATKNVQVVVRNILYTRFTSV